MPFCSCTNSHPLTSMQIFTKNENRLRGTRRRGSNARGVAKYSNFGPVEASKVYLGNGAR